MAPLTDTLPKPLIKVAGQPLIGHALALARDAGIGRIVANTHHRADLLAPWLAGQGVLRSHEEVLLDTGGGLRAALPLLGKGPVLTLNTDAVWTGANPVARLARAWRPDDMDALLCVVAPDRAAGHRGRGDFLIAADGRLTWGPGLIYTGVQIIKPEVLDLVEDPVFSLRRIWEILVQQGRLFGLRHAGRWCDVGQPDSIALAEAMLETGDDV